MVDRYAGWLMCQAKKNVPRRVANSPGGELEIRQSQIANSSRRIRYPPRQVRNPPKQIANSPKGELDFRQQGKLLIRQGALDIRQGNSQELFS